MNSRGRIRRRRHFSPFYDPRNWSSIIRTRRKPIIEDEEEEEASTLETGSGKRRPNKTSTSKFQIFILDDVSPTKNGEIVFKNSRHGLFLKHNNLECKIGMSSTLSHDLQQLYKTGGRVWDSIDNPSSCKKNQLTVL